MQPRREAGGAFSLPYGRMGENFFLSRIGQHLSPRGLPVAFNLPQQRHTLPRPNTPRIYYAANETCAMGSGELLSRRLWEDLAAYDSKYPRPSARERGKRRWLQGAKQWER